ncbi:uncharacterized protein LAESUDRAFT_716509 [Laetiporus sulphureus 93-53]|uniref:Uncharacterized protein n=1 Tax=Laetiporus sulphureus 93-53 TaxID=1314785 RepID=A0A165CJF1_9APHY|nr:uncharacterized protein LAESUDRAFT_716509 [Laetiporus sulphureus 93-53]KZT02919.1 hypothetical protein LAESUDRAFT_716509 [Laetiporus sulphureus 93-53]
MKELYGRLLELLDVGDLVVNLTIGNIVPALLAASFEPEKRVIAPYPSCAPGGRLCGIKKRIRINEREDEVLFLCGDEVHARTMLQVTYDDFICIGMRSIFPELLNVEHHRGGAFQINIPTAGQLDDAYFFAANQGLHSSMRFDLVIDLGPGTRHSWLQHDTLIEEEVSAFSTCLPPRRDAPFGWYPIVEVRQQVIGIVNNNGDLAIVPSIRKS